MKLFIITSAATRHIIPASVHQWKKYTRFDPIVIDVDDAPLNTWSTHVMIGLLEKARAADGHIIMALDDFLVIDHYDPHIFNFVTTNFRFDRYELGWGATNKKPTTKLHSALNYEVHQYNSDAPYKISCQPSVWNIEFLMEVLGNEWSPWHFEVRGSEMYNGATVLGTKGNHALRYQEETALSIKRNKGQINMLGVKPEDVEELIELGHIDKGKINYGINNGPREFDISLAGKKYEEFYR